MYFVNYGPNVSHRKLNTKSVSTYKEAIAIFNGIDRDQYGCSEIVSPSWSEGSFQYCTDLTVKRYVDVDNAKYKTQKDKQILLSEGISENQTKQVG